VEYIIDEGRRSGIDRRGDDREATSERRDIIKDQGRYLPIIRKVPLFRGLQLVQFTKILRICAKHAYAAGQAVILSGAESKEMFILIKGSLKVVFDDGKELSRITPVELVGEMGMFTNEVRSASVVAVEESIVLAINKKELIDLFRNDSDLGILVLMNVICDLSHKLKKSNAVTEELRKICQPGQYTGVLKKIQNDSSLKG